MKLWNHLALTLKGKTPTGKPFAIHAHNNGKEVTSRVLEYLPHDGVGPIVIPMRAKCMYGKLYYELTHLGHVEHETARTCFLT